MGNLRRYKPTESEIFTLSKCSTFLKEDFGIELNAKYVYLKQIPNKDLGYCEFDGKIFFLKTAQGCRGVTHEISHLLFEMHRKKANLYLPNFGLKFDTVSTSLHINETRVLGIQYGIEKYLDLESFFDEKFYNNSAFLQGFKIFEGLINTLR